MTLEQVREIVSEAVAEHRDPNETQHRSPPSGARATLIVDCDEPAAFSRGGGG